ncbi:MAG: alpha/beta fold hydrolase [Myxococcota bacterium]
MSQPKDTEGGVTPEEIVIPARDGYPLAASLFRPAEPTGRVVVVSSATAVRRRFYRRFACALAEAGYATLTYDYRGIGDSAPPSLRGFDARVRDWVEKDMSAVVDHARDALRPDKLFLVGHSVGGQLAGLLESTEDLDGMITLSSQSGHWRMQGGEQKAMVFLHTHLTLPLLTRLYGYMPWSSWASGEDLPKGAALEWARWCRMRNYLLDDATLPLERYALFRAPVLAYSIGDDKWGTPRSVDAMMGAYPVLERRHVEPEGKPLGHFGWFRDERLWGDAIAWLDARSMR